jgi:hypothetical protein
MRLALFVLSSSLVLTPPLALAQSSMPAERDRLASTCPAIDAAARAHDLPVSFFARVIWQESRFHPDVLGPITRSGQRAQGIAQFMPGTAVERRLLDPFNPDEALPKSAEFLAELRERFGNLGLAAAAYNAGPQRVVDFIAGARDLPAETRNYVLAITGHLVEDWLKVAKQNSEGPDPKPPPKPAAETCLDLLNSLQIAHYSLGEELQHRIGLAGSWPVRRAIEMQYVRVPSWCQHLHHPLKAACGPVHEAERAIKTSSLLKLKAH